MLISTVWSFQLNIHLIVQPASEDILYCRHKCLCLGLAWIPWCTAARKQEAFEQEVTQASVWRCALPTPSSVFIFLFLCTTKDRDTAFTDNHKPTLPCPPPIVAMLMSLPASNFVLKSVYFMFYYLFFFLIMIKMEPVPCSFKSQPPSSPGNNRPSTICLKPHMWKCRECWENTPSLPQLPLPQPRTNSRRISVFTGTVTQSARISLLHQTGSST